MNIVIPADYQNAVEQLDCFGLLKEHSVKILNYTDTSVNRLKKDCMGADALVLIRERTEINEELLKDLPGLKLISQTGKVSKHIDVAACTKYKIAIAEGTGSPVSTAELTWALILNAKRKLPTAIENMRKGFWQTNIGSSLKGETIGIWGYGKIGRRIAAYAKAFEMRVLIWGSKSSRDTALTDGFDIAFSAEHFFSEADILTLHLRLTPETNSIVKIQHLALMKPDALLVNTSRSELLEKNSLLNALTSGRPGFAALDVYDEEPVTGIKNPFLHMPNVLCTPHLGYVEKNSYELYFTKAFENVNAFANGMPLNIINPHVL